MKDDKKIAFIIAVNKPSLFKECKRYLQRLTLPEGFRMEIIPVEGAVSMTAAYEVEIFQSLFPNVFAITSFEELDDDFKVKNITKVVTAEELDAYEVETSVITKQYKETWQENEEALEQILKILRKINADMKIKLVMLPRCSCIEKRMEKYDAVLKPQYYEILHNLQKKYDFEIFDLKGAEEISSHYEYYYDGEHLNRKGAEAFTRYFIENCMG